MLIQNQNDCGAPAGLFSVLASCPFVFRVFVADSLIKGAGQGLFAKMDAEANTVMSFYNGVRITHTEVKSTQVAYHSRAYTVGTQTIQTPFNFSTLCFTAAICSNQKSSLYFSLRYTQYPISTEKTQKCNFFPNSKRKTEISHQKYSDLQILCCDLTHMLSIFLILPPSLLLC